MREVERIRSDVPGLRVGHSVTGWLSETENWIAAQVENLPACCDVSVLADHRVDDPVSDRPEVFVSQELTPVRYHIGRLLRRLNLPQPAWIRGGIVEEAGDLDILHSHFAPRGWYDRGLEADRSIPHVVSVYGFDVTVLPERERRWKKRYQDLFQRVDVVLCEGPYMEKRLQRLGCPADKTSVVRIGVELEEYPFTVRKWDKGELLRVLIASRFTEKKGIPDAIEALGNLRREVDLEVTLIGDRLDGQNPSPEKERIREAIDEAELWANMNILGSVNHRRLTQEALGNHIFIQASRTADNGDEEGGAPVTLIEMLATGMPIVATRHCDIPEVTPEGSWLAEEGNPESLEEELRDCLQQADQWPEVGKRGREFVERHHSAENQGARLGEIYIDLIRGET